MADVVLSNVSKAFAETRVLDDIELDIRSGEFVVFVGPSGCGKSTLLRVIAGLETANTGEVRIGDQRVDTLAPSERGVAMVFQSYALYPHLSVYDNMAFGLRLAKVDKSEINRRVLSAAEVLDVTHLLQRKPKALSGGQRQRVAIGRAIVREPKVFLFDEPLSNLDAELRVKMRYEFARLHRGLGATMIYVTHDQTEAMTLADRIVVLQGGRIEQVGAPLELYERPANAFVAGFIGSPRMNFLDGVVSARSAGAAAVTLAGGVSLSAAVDASRAKVGDPVKLGVRPESWRLLPAPEAGAEAGVGALACKVEFVERLGALSFAYVSSDAGNLTLQLPPSVSLSMGESVAMTAAAGDCHLFDAKGQAFERILAPASVN
jgi:multiple sugar transport system ATP-binding protein